MRTSTAETPSPCVDCNTYVKFGALLGRARHLYDCEAVATGHYARRDVGPDGQARLLRARDADKDQTYFLYGLRQDQLEHARFPLGELTKPEVREVARGLGLATADKPESQEICFVPGGDYRDALRDRAGWVPEAGPLLDRRRRAGGGAPRDAGLHRRPAPGARRRARRAALRQPDRSADQHDHARPAPGSRDDHASSSSGRASSPATRRAAGRRSVPRSGSATAPRRSPATVRPATANEPARGGRWLVETDTPVWAAAPGQAAVLYDGDVVIGGGRIARPMPAETGDRARPDRADGVAALVGSPS